MINFISSSLPLGLDGIKILLHLMNFLILLTGVTVLVYKPVKKFMDKRQKEIKDQYDSNEKAKADAEFLHKEYLQRLEKADTEIMMQRADAERNSHMIKENAISVANQKAEEIIVNAEEEAASIRKETIKDIENKVAEVAVSIASAILEREISAKENEEIIEKCINDWTKNE
jgi:F-type H+-transporting ATPase subunit b